MQGHSAEPRLGSVWSTVFRVDHGQGEHAQERAARTVEGLEHARERAWKEQEGDAGVGPSGWLCVHLRGCVVLDNFTRCCWTESCNAEYHQADEGSRQALLCRPIAPSAVVAAVFCDSPTPSPGRMPRSTACIISKASSSHMLNFVQSTGLSPWAVISCPRQHQQGQ